MGLKEDIETSIQHATNKISEAETPEEASQWQGIVNQQLVAYDKLQLDQDSQEAINLVEE